MKNININKDKTYSKYEIVLGGWLGKTEATVRKKLLEDMAGTGILKVQVSGTGTMKRYMVKGEDLLKYLEAGVNQ